MAKQLILGTLFTGDVAPKFWASIKKMKNGFRSLGSELRRLKRELRKAKQTINELNKPMNSKAPGKYAGALARIGSAFKTMITYGGVAAVLYAITSAFRAGVTEIFEYDQALKNLQAISGATSQELGIMGETIKHIASTTKFSTAEIGQGMVLLSQAGFKASEAVQSMEAVANLATGTLSSMATVADLLTTSVRAFGLSTIESGRVSDVMANAVNKSKLTVDKLRIAFNFAGAASAQAGLSIEQTAASMMVLANNGLRASTIGTGFRQVLKRLIAPNEKLRESFINAGVSLNEITISETQDYEKVLLNLSKVLFDTASDTVNMAKAFELFGLRGSQAVAILVKEFVNENFNTALSRTYEVGTAAKMAGIQIEGLKVKLKNMTDKLKLFAIALGEAGIGAVFAIFIDSVRYAADALSFFTGSSVVKSIVQVALLTTAMWGLVRAYGGLLLVLNSAGMTKFIAMMLSPYMGGNVFGVAAIGVSILILSLVKLHSAYRDAGDEASRLATKQEGIGIAASSYIAALENINKKLKAGTLKQEEYEAVIKRIIEDHPELKKQLDLAVTGIEANITAIKDFKAEHFDEEMKKSAAAILQYNAALEQGTFFSSTRSRMKQLWEGIVNSYAKQSLTNINSIGRTTEALNDQAKALQDLSTQAKKTDDPGLVKAKNDEYLRQIDAIIAIQKIDKSYNIDRHFAGLGITLPPNVKDELAILLKERIVYLNKLSEATAKNKAALAAGYIATLPPGFQGYLDQAGTVVDSQLLKIFKAMKAAQATERESWKNFYNSKGIDKAVAEKKIAKTMAMIQATAMLDSLKALRKIELDGINKRITAVKAAITAYKRLPKEDQLSKAGELDSLKAELEAVRVKAATLRAEFVALIDKYEALNNHDLTFLDSLTIGLDDATSKLNQVKEKTEDATKTFIELFEGVGENFIDKFADGLASIGSGTESLQDKFQKMAQSMMQDIIALLLKLAILKGMLKMGGGEGFLHNIATSGLTKMGVLSATSSVAKVVSPISSSIQPSTLSNNLPVVSQRSFVNTNTGSSVGGSGGSVNVFKIDAVDAQSFVKMLSSREAQSVFVNSVMNNKNHNGVVRSAG